jgi:serine/threonine-protein kinase
MQDLQIEPKRKRVSAALVVPLVGLVCLILFLGGFFDRVDLGLYDLYYGIRGPVPPSEQIVLVGIDQASLAKIGRWPWPRGRFAPLIETIRNAGARTIGLGVIFQEDPDQEASGENAALGSAIAGAGNVVLPMEFAFGAGAGSGPPPERILQSGLPRIQLSQTLNEIRVAGEAFEPAPTIAAGAAGFGHLNYIPDPDQTFRWCPTLVAHDQRAYPAFPLAVARHFLTANRESISTGEWVVRVGGDVEVPVDASADMLIAYIGGERTFPTYSAVDVLEGEVPPEAFRNKTVLIGPTDPTLAGALRTPVTAGMSALELNAHVLDDVLNRRFYRRGPFMRMLEFVAFLAMAVVSALVIPRLKAVAGAVLALALILSALGASLLLFLTAGIWMKPFYPMLVVGLSYVAATALSFRATEKEKQVAEEARREAQTMLGLSFQEKGMLDMAMQTFNKIPFTPDMKSIYYSLGVDFENKGQREKAFAAFKRIVDVDPGFQDVSARIAALREGGMGTQMLSADVQAEIQGAAAQMSARPASAPRAPQWTELSGRFGRYEIQKKIGKGAMGDVYLVQDPKIGRVAALKTIRVDPDAAPQEVIELKQRFYREAQTAGKLSHPNIVTIYDVDEQEGISFIVMEYVKGITLGDIIKKRIALKNDQVKHLMEQSASALAYAHAAGIVHRDIKPDNIMVIKEGLKVKVMDFGIARITESTLTATGSALGTPAYMSPEQFRGQKVDGRSDIFSMGVVLYELLTGERPFQGDLSTLMFQILQHEPPPPAERNAAVHPDWNAVVARAMAKEPADRFATAEELGAAIRAVGTPAFVPPPTPPRPAPPPARPAG